jgi:hypothetical protein
MLRRVSVLVWVFCVLLISCKTFAPAEIPVRTETVIRERLVAVEVPADSATVLALLECDSLNNVRLVELNELKSKRVESDFNMASNTQKQTALNYSVRVVHDTVRVAARDSIVYKDVPLRVEAPVEVNRITGWQWFQIWMGRIFILALVLVLGFEVITKTVLKKKL